MSYIIPYKFSNSKISKKKYKIISAQNLILFIKTKKLMFKVLVSCIHCRYFTWKTSENSKH